MKRQQQNQFLKDAAKEFSFRNNDNANTNNTNDDDSVSLGRLLPATTPQEEESEDVSTLSSSASSSSGGGEDDSSSSSSSEEHNIMDVEQQVLDSAKDYLYKDNNKDASSRTSLEMEDIVGKLPTIVSSPKPTKDTTRKHYNRYSMTDYHNSKYGIGGDYDEYVLDLNRDLYRRNKFLRHVID